MSITRDAITIFGFSVRFYGILIALGVAGGLFIMDRREKSRGLIPDASLSLALWMVPAAIVCARLYYVAFEWSAYRDRPLSILNIREGGLAIYGGILGGAAAAAVWTRVKRVPFLAMADLAAPALAFGQALGRWGNFLNQEAYGRAVSDPAWQFFPAAVFIEREQGWFAATFFYESAWCLLICTLILTLEKRSPAFSRPGRAAAFYAVLYAFERAIVESLRTDSLYWGSVRVSQMLSALALTACAACLVPSMKKNAARRVCAVVGAACAFALLLSAAKPSLTGFSGLLASDAGLLAVCLTAFFSPGKADAHR